MWVDVDPLHAEYRRRKQDTPGLDLLQASARKFLNSLEKCLPCVNAQTGASSHDTTKNHAVLHFPELRCLAGDPINFSTAAGELGHKDIVKTKAKLSNNHKETLGLSLLRTNKRATVAKLLCQEMAGNIYLSLYIYAVSQFILCYTALIHL